MPPRIRKSNDTLGTLIQTRRLELGMTIEEAAAKAQVGAKTWGKYENGESMRQDKVRGVCRALRWKTLPDTVQSDIRLKSSIGDSPSFNDDGITIDESHDAWSAYLAETFGRDAAIAFAYGSDIQFDQISEDLAELGKLPRGSHLGQLDCSWTADLLPEQFLTRYDYEFVYALRQTVNALRTRFTRGYTRLHSVIEELTFYLILQEADSLPDVYPPFAHGDYHDGEWEEWFGDVCGDTDLIDLLYGDYVISPDNIYHFDHWLKQQFYMPQPKGDHQPDDTQDDDHLIK
ncbi:helix-turn-helix domain-containing protein [Bifidobacterium felsineum]|uniref:Transcriptional regulator n=1 Tax=Bifidobacterium felsineum TaxID=2045440 RepID=A0A2M9HLD8_9BIFI|nr:helix-turn-helix transcriptional regulator [Bifidobacterium felsineum]MBT1163135.1 helix-turn-helix transcriptional regulator [Bifidobacterium felsineum]PJM77626.1 transcriptional regulator [Bifidobacterium felsineum]